MEEAKGKKYKFACPYCTREIVWGSKQCPWCGASYGLDTLRILKSDVEELREEEVDERRRNDRIPRKFKIAYSSPHAFVSNYLSNISLGGVSIKTDHPLQKGTHFDLKIALPDGGEELEVSCEVVWVKSKETAEGQGEGFSGMGVKFLNLSSRARERIARILQQR